MRIVAFLTDAPAIRQILDHIGEPSTPPPIVTAGGPPGWNRAETTQEDPSCGDYLLSIRSPIYDHDQSLSDVCLWQIPSPGSHLDRGEGP
jgi:hypothetical protein